MTPERFIDVILGMLVGWAISLAVFVLVTPCGLCHIATRTDLEGKR